MATVQANLALDVDALNFFEVTSHAFGSNFFDNVNLSFNGRVYNDVAEVLWANNGNNLKSSFGGTNLTVDNTGTVVTGGTVLAFWQSVEISPGTFLPTWTVQDISIPAVTLFQAFLTPSTADDQAVIQTALAGNDTILGSSFSDNLKGFAGNDTLKGGAGKDTLDGGAGLDTADYGDKTLAVAVTLAAAANATVKVNGVIEDTIRNIENVIGGSGNDSLTGDGLTNILTGGAGNDTLKGGVGKDTLDGGAGLDTADYSDKTLAVSLTLAGAANANVLVGAVVEDTVRNIENVIGGSGNDLLTGDGLANILMGGAGKDTLTGGSSGDTFKYTSIGDSGVGSSTRDLVADFAVINDKIDLSTIDANTGIGLDQAFAFIQAAAFSGIAGQLRSVAGAANTIVSGDINGDSTADFSIELTGGHTLTAGNFVL